MHTVRLVLIFLYAHRETSILTGEFPEESEQFRFLWVVRLVNIKSRHLHFLTHLFFHSNLSERHMMCVHFQNFIGLLSIIVLVRHFPPNSRLFYSVVINKIIIYRHPQNAPSVRRVNPEVLAFSLSLHRHPHNINTNLLETTKKKQARDKYRLS